MIHYDQFHPHLRVFDEGTLEYRLSFWGGLFTPAPDKIHFYGDARLYCREVDYQHVLDNVPCATSTYKGYRACALEGNDLDRWREQVRRWLACYDLTGKQIKEWVPLQVPQTVEPTITAGPQPPKRAPWFGTKLSLYLKRGKPD